MNYNVVCLSLWICMTQNKVTRDDKITSEATNIERKRTSHE